VVDPGGARITMRSLPIQTWGLAARHVCGIDEAGMENGSKARTRIFVGRRPVPDGVCFSKPWSFSIDFQEFIT